MQIWNNANNVWNNKKAFDRRAHIEREIIICKQSFEWKKITKRAFEFTKQTIAIRIVLFIVMNVDF